MGHLDIHNQYNNQFAEQEQLNSRLVLYGKCCSMDSIILRLLRAPYPHRLQY